MNRTYKNYRGKSKHNSGGIFGNAGMYLLFSLAIVFMVGMICALFMPPKNGYAQEGNSLPQVETNLNFVKINTYLSYEEETNLVYLRNIYRNNQEVYSIYYDASGKPMTYNGEDIPFNVETIGHHLVVDTNTSIVYRQETSTRKNYSAYYGSDGLPQYYENGNLHSVNS